MMVARLAAEERPVAAFARYGPVWPDGEPLEVAADRLELCRAMLDLDETLPAEAPRQRFGRAPRREAAWRGLPLRPPTATTCPATAVLRLPLAAARLVPAGWQVRPERRVGQARGLADRGGPRLQGVPVFEVDQDPWGLAAGLRWRFHPVVARAYRLGWARHICMRPGNDNLEQDRSRGCGVAPRYRARTRPVAGTGPRAGAHPCPQTAHTKTRSSDHVVGLYRKAGARITVESIVIGESSI